MKLQLSIFLEEINNDRKEFCSLLSTDYGHGTGFPGQGIFNFFQVREKSGNFFFGQGNFENTVLKLS